MRRRILFAIVGVAAGAVILLALPLGVAVQKLYRDDEVLELERNATAAARGFDTGSGRDDPVEFQPSSDQLAAYSLDGHLLGGQGPATADEVVADALSTGQVGDVSSDDRLTVAIPVIGAERVVGAIRGSRTTAELSERVLRVRLLIAGAALLIIALATAAALLLSRRLTRPVGELADVAAAVGEPGPSLPAPRSGIEELDVVAAALDAMVQRLDDLVARERSFSANASHQLRTPLAALRLDLELRQLEGVELDDAIEQVDRLEETIGTLLAAARDIPGDREPFLIDELIEEVRLRWTGPLAAVGRALEVQSSGDDSLVMASEPAVREVLDVLLDNAHRHGGGTVRLRSRPISGHQAVDVSDEGPGIDRPEELFVRGVGAQHGIGLALARSLAAAEGGRLDLTDATAGATTFTLLLRIAEDGKGNVGANPGPGQDATGSSDSRS